MVRNVGNIPLPLWRSKIFDTPPTPLPLLTENTGNNLRRVSRRFLTQNLCDFTAILLMDVVLTLPKFSKKFMIIQIIQT